MKTAILATAFALTSTVAMAEGLGGSAEIEYSIENDNFAMEAGPDLSVGGLAIAPRAYASINDSVISFDGVGIEAAYGLTANVTVYGAAQTDGDWEYSDAQVGVRFSF